MNVTFPPPPTITIDDDLLGSGRLGKVLCVSPATISRYNTKGVLVSGHRIKLPSIRIGGKRYSTRAAVDWWLTAQQLAEQATTVEGFSNHDDDFDREAEAELEAIAEREGL